MTDNRVDAALDCALLAVYEDTQPFRPRSGFPHELSLIVDALAAKY